MAQYAAYPCWQPLMLQLSPLRLVFVFIMAACAWLEVVVCTVLLALSLHCHPVASQCCWGKVRIVSELTLLRLRVLMILWFAPDRSWS